MEQAVLRGTARHPLQVGDDVLIGPRAYLTGCTVEDEAFLATGSTVFNAARVGRGATVRINGTVHLRTTLPPGVKLPIGWVAIGDPVELLPPGEHERIIALLGQLDFSGTVFGLPYRPDGRLDMPQVTGRYTRALGRHQHDRVVDGPGPAGP
jgi:hypothetical protein